MAGRSLAAAGGERGRGPAAAPRAAAGPLSGGQKVAAGEAALPRRAALWRGWPGVGLAGEKGEAKRFFDLIFNCLLCGAVF